MASSFGRFLGRLRQSFHTKRSPRPRRALARLNSFPGLTLEHLEERITPATNIDFTSGTGVLTINVLGTNQDVLLSVAANTQVLSVTSNQGTTATPSATAAPVSFSASTAGGTANKGNLGTVNLITVAVADKTDTVEFQGGTFTAVNFSTTVGTVDFDQAASRFSLIAATAKQSSLSVTADTVQLSQNISTLDPNGTVDLTGATGGITVSGNVSIDTTVGGKNNVTFHSSVDSGASAGSLTVKSTASTTFAAAIGSSSPLASLTTSGATGTTALNGPSVKTSDGQSYSNPVTLGAAATALTSTNNGNLTFSGSVNGASALSVSTGGTTTFSAAVGNGTALTSFSTAATGTTAINGGTLRTTGAAEWRDHQHHGGPVLQRCRDSWSRHDPDFDGRRQYHLQNGHWIVCADCQHLRRHNLRRPGRHHEQSAVQCDDRRTGKHAI
jgi:hypothetical protein